MSLELLLKIEMLIICYNASRFEKLMRAAKKADNDFRGALKSVGPSTKFKLDEEPKEVSTFYSIVCISYACILSSIELFLYSNIL